MAPPTTKQPSTVPIPALPTVEDVPRNSAVDAEIMAATLLSTVQKWAPLAIAASDFHGAGEMRRLVSPVATKIMRRQISKTATLDAQYAARIVDRVVGKTIAEGMAAGAIRSRHSYSGSVGVHEIIGVGDRSGIMRLAAATESEFLAAIRASRETGSLGLEALVGHLGTESLTPKQQAQRERILELASEGYTSRQIAGEINVSAHRVAELARRYGVTIAGDAVSRNTRTLDYVRIITEVIPIIDGVASAATQLNPADIAKISPAQAKDWAQQMGKVLAPVAALQRSLRDRGKERN